MMCLPPGDRGSETVYGRYVNLYDEACKAAVNGTYKDASTKQLDDAAREARDKLPQAQRAKVRKLRMLKVPDKLKELTQAIQNYPLRPCEDFWREHRNRNKEEKQSLSNMKPAEKKSYFEDWLKRVSAVYVLLQLKELKQKQQSKRKRKANTIPGQIEGAAADDGEPHEHHKKPKSAVASTCLLRVNLGKKTIGANFAPADSLYKLIDLLWKQYSVPMDTCTVWYQDANGKKVLLKPGLTFAKNGMEAGNTYNIEIHQNKSMQKPEIH